MARSGARGSGPRAVRAAHALDRPRPRPADGRRPGRARPGTGTLARRGRSRGRVLLRRRLVHGRGGRRGRGAISATPTARGRRSGRITCLPARRTSRSTSRPGSSSRAGDASSSCRRRTRSGCSHAAALGRYDAPVVHAYFHDTDLLDRRRRAALVIGLAVLGARRKAADLAELQRGLRPEKTMSFANSRA